MSLAAVFCMEKDGPAPNKAVRLFPDVPIKPNEIQKSQRAILHHHPPNESLRRQTLPLSAPSYRRRRLQLTACLRAQSTTPAPADHQPSR